MTVVPESKPRQTAWPARPSRIQIRPGTSPEDAAHRPLTATLEHPLMINEALISKLDMTIFTKEGLLAITKLCTVPVVSSGKKRKTKLRVRAIKNMEEDDSSSASDVVRKSKELKEPRRVKKLLASPGTKVDAVFGETLKVPEPCTTCGRPEQPERLHSHPANETIPKVPEKSSKPKVVISKPIPANFRSAEKLRREKEGSGKNGTGSASSKTGAEAPRPRSGRPRTITCYICSREFGTASYPLHEPKCKQKWELENEQLPMKMRRKLPEKPAGNMGIEEWNEFAWQASQAILVPCQKCGRTFNPDRLTVHLRSCVGTNTEESTQSSANDTSPTRPPTVPCYICLREFGTKSIAIHEPQCLRKWQQENAALPQALQRPDPQKPDIDTSRITGCYICGEQIPILRERPVHERACIQKWRRANSARPEGERLPEPQRPDYRFTETGEVDYHGTWNAIWSNHQDSLIPCRQCGRKFFPDRIVRHEEACGNQPIKSKR